MTSTQNVPEDRIQIGQLRSAYGLNGGSGCIQIPMSNMFDYLPGTLRPRPVETIDVKRWKHMAKAWLLR